LLDGTKQSSTSSGDGLPTTTRSTATTTAAETSTNSDAARAKLKNSTLSSRLACRSGEFELFTQNIY
jgi:hypothetical protein